MYRLLPVLGALLTLSACATPPPLQVLYKPSTSAEVYAAVSVGPFDYTPPEGKPDSLVPNTAVRAINLGQPLGMFHADALKRELRSAGASLNGKVCKIDGSIDHVLVDDLGFYADVFYDATYRVFNAETGETRYTLPVAVEYRLSKGVGPRVVLRMFAQSIDTLLKDDGFIRTVESECPL